METTVQHKTEIVSGKEYPLTVTRQIGYQELIIRGEKIPVESVTTFDSPLGHSVCYTRAKPELTPEDKAAIQSRIKEVATQAMIDQGIW